MRLVPEADTSASSLYVLASGMSAEQHRRAAPAVLGFAVLTVSDTRAAGGRRQRPYASAIWPQPRGTGSMDSTLVPDDVAAIRGAVRRMLELPGVDVVVTDRRHRLLAARRHAGRGRRRCSTSRVEGFGELFRMLSYQQVGAAAMLSRAAAGTGSGTKAVFLLPGSPKAVALAMEKLILPEAGAPARPGAADPHRLIALSRPLPASPRAVIAVARDHPPDDQQQDRADDGDDQAAEVEARDAAEAERGGQEAAEQRADDRR